MCVAMLMGYAIFRSVTFLRTLMPVCWLVGWSVCQTITIQQSQYNDSIGFTRNSSKPMFLFFITLQNIRHKSGHENSSIMLTSALLGTMEV